MRQICPERMLKNIRPIQKSSNQTQYYLRLIGSESCLFGKSLDQVYFNKGFLIPKDLNSKLIPAHEVLQNEELSPQKALEVFLRLSAEKSLLEKVPLQA